LKLIHIHHRSSHHAQNSGYARLLDYFSGTQVPSGKKIMPYRLAKFISDNINQKAGIYDSSSVFKEVELLKILLKYPKDKKVVHYLNAERDIRFTVNKREMFTNTSFLGTFHKPPEILIKGLLKNNYIKKLNGAIAVGENQVSFLKNWLDIENVKYIPHGVDTTFFKPNYTKRKENTLLFVGQHLRDFDTFNYCIPRLSEKIKNLEVNVILRKDFFNKIKPHSSISLHSNINDVKLKAFYQEASALFLPMINSTACNSILEAMASGTPIITSDVGGNRGYLNDTESILYPTNDKDYLIDSTINLLKNDIQINIMGNSSRLKSLDFDWQKISNKISIFYNIV
jgi:glycosyltransferase involved in cell wall biosynthesis